MKGDQLFDDCALRSIKEEARLIHQDLVAWMRDFHQYCQKHPIENAAKSAHDMRRELVIIYKESVAVVQRLTAAVCDQHRVKIEHHVQSLANEIMLNEDAPVPHYSWLFCGHEKLVARSIQLSKHEWEGEDIYDSSHDKAMAMRTRFTNWDNYIKSNYY